MSIIYGSTFVVGIAQLKLFLSSYIVEIHFLSAQLMQNLRIVLGSVNSRLCSGGETTYLGVNLMYFVLGDFLGEGNVGF